MASKIVLLLLVAILVLAALAVMLISQPGILENVMVAEGRRFVGVTLTAKDDPTEAPPTAQSTASPIPPPTPLSTATPTPTQEPPTSTPLPVATPTPTRPAEPTPRSTAGPAAAQPAPTSTPTTASVPKPPVAGTSLGRVVGSGCYAGHKEGDQWPETVGSVKGVVTCSNDLYYFNPAPFSADNPLANTIVAYYGNRAAGTMGILGEYPLPELEKRLREQARLVDEANGDAGVTLAFDYIYLVANGSAHPYSHYTPRLDLFEEALTFAEEKGFLFFIDLQLGYRDIETEVKKVLPYLLKPNVHLAIDTEFYMHRRKGVPGDTLGSMDAEDINKIQDIMQQYITENKLPDKILKVYQFDQIMLTNKDKLKVDTPNVRVLINADGVGFGGVAGKISDYNEYAEQPRNALGIKLFFKWDARLLSPEELMALTPPPNEIVYQ